MLRLAVLVKPVPDPASGGERLDADDRRLDRTAAPGVINGNDEYALEAALKLAEAHEGEVTAVAMAPPAGADVLRKALAMGAQRAVHVTDPALAGSCAQSTIAVLAAALGELEFDLLLAGADTSDSGSGIIHAGLAARLRLPLLSYAARIEPDPAAGSVRVRQIRSTGFDVLEAPFPALVVCTQALGEPRYPSLKGIMAARSKEIRERSLADLGLDPAAVGGAATTTRVLDVRTPPARGATRVIREAPDEAARQVVAFLAERRLI